MATTVTPVTNRKPGYRDLLRTPGAWTFLLPGFLARQPFAMLTLGIVLLVEDTTGSFGTAGAVSAVTGVSMALFAPRSGRLADRFGQRAVLVPGVLLHAAAVGVLAALALSRAPLWALLLAAVPAGASVPQVGPMVRARWAHLLRGGPGSPDGSGPPGGPGGARLLSTAAAFESVTDELTFVIGPVLATALCTGVHPAAGLAAEAALTVVGGLLFAAQRRTAPPAHRRARGADGAPHASALSVPGVRVLIVAFLGIGAVFGGMQVSMAAFTDSIGQPGLNGVLYGIFAAGNMLAGLVFGALTWRSAPQRRLLAAYALLTLTTAPLWAVDVVPLLAVLGLLTGMGIAPSLITGFTLVERLVPAGVRTEAFTWMAGAVALGQAVAASAAGQLTDGFGASAGFTVPLAATALALVTVAALRGWLKPDGGQEGDGQTDGGKAGDGRPGDRRPGDGEGPRTG
ncbi:MFS transporter [Streptomyces radiopugnans]|uniref:Predicted arabinose efflux permease, MFS family n=1 Tax=Streptomyces radiopugnans TaxID=403935 RepID=A0A1H9GZK4_9ACTN|nr:MFS transporter [Streptomyces radiopugnans]SEQ55423.1 Predicted arabinose efflux permease, MFS family [Streptomyces radiopugnans]